MKPSEYFVYFEGFIPHLRDKRSAQSAKGLLDCRTIKNRTPKIRCALYRTLIFRLPPDLAPFPFGQVAGFHRAVPSTALDKAVCNFRGYYTRFFPNVNPFPRAVSQNCKKRHHSKAQPSYCERGSSQSPIFAFCPEIFRKSIDK